MIYRPLFWFWWLAPHLLPINHHAIPHPPPVHVHLWELSAKGRTNIELREQFILADGVSQSMAAFKPRMSTPGSHHGSPSPVPMSSQGPIMKVNASRCPPWVWSRFFCTKVAWTEDESSNSLFILLLNIHMNTLCGTTSPLSFRPGGSSLLYPCQD